MPVNDIDLDRIIAGVAGSAPESRPLDRLSAARATATRLESLAQHVVAHFVDEARRGGASWTDIGSALGVTRQAAQQRFVPASGIELEAATDAPAVPFSSRAEHALEAARNLASEHHHRTVDDLHLLLALLDIRNGGAATAVKALGRRLADLRKTARMHLAADGPKRATKTTALGRTCHRALQVATREALRFGRNTVGTEHLLLALSSDSGSAAGQALAEAGVSYDRLRAEITQLPMPDDDAPSKKSARKKA